MTIEDNVLINLLKKDDLSKIAIFTHNTPDPDAIGSIMALEWMIKKINPSIECNAFFDGHISHPQNIAMFNLLDPNMKNISEYDKNNNYDLCFLVDTVPANAGIGDNVINFDLVIDHHKEIPNGGFSGIFINLKAGSCCGTIYSLIKNNNLSFKKDNDYDSKVATAIMVGISTDTESLMSDDATEYEFSAWSELFEYRDVNILKKIIHFTRPKFWVECKANAINDMTLFDGVCIVGIGVIPGKHRDMIADLADEMIIWEDVNTSVAFAIIDGERIEGSVRSRNASVMVPTLCKQLATKHGQGGGKLGKGAYKYNLGGISIDDDDDDEMISKTWNTLKEKEIKRISKVIKQS
jgi:nanoRNase/pAp phosphatase (c-di-AMP/oligoRNAs hydrolase)